MKKYVSRCTVTRNGSRLSDMKNFKVNEETYRNEVALMDENGTVDTNGKYGFSLDYAIPKTNPKLDWRDVEDETWSCKMKNGKTITFPEVDCLKRGEIAIDGEKETVITLTFVSGKPLIQ